MLPLLLLAGPLAAAATPFDYSLLRLGALPAHASKAQLVQRLGQPTKTSRPRYECGEHADEPGRPYYQLHYAQATYIGRAASEYELETVYFVPGGASLRYGTTTWDASTTLASMQKLFGADARLAKQTDGTVQLTVTAKVPHTTQLADDWLVLTFRNSRLVSYGTGEGC
jgi:hypothetical protein